MLNPTDCLDTVGAETISADGGASQPARHSKEFGANRPYRRRADLPKQDHRARLEHCVDELALAVAAIITNTQAQDFT
jgi:hypothetical protein